MATALRHRHLLLLSLRDLHLSGSKFFTLHSSLYNDLLTVLNNDTLIALEDTLTAQVVNWFAIAEDVVSVVHQLFV